MLAGPRGGLFSLAEAQAGPTQATTQLSVGLHERQEDASHAGWRVSLPRYARPGAGPGDGGDACEVRPQASRQVLLLRQAAPGNAALATRVSEQAAREDSDGRRWERETFFCSMCSMRPV